MLNYNFENQIHDSLFLFDPVPQEERGAPSIEELQTKRQTARRRLHIKETAPRKFRSAIETRAPILTDGAAVAGFEASTPNTHVQAYLFLSTETE